MLGRVEDMQRQEHVMAASELHADDTPVPAAGPVNGKTKTRRYGHMFATIAQPPTRRHRRYGSHDCK
jgi:hypothetical protein